MPLCGFLSSQFYVRGNRESSEDSILAEARRFYGDNRHPIILPPRYLGPIVIAERDPENEGEKGSRIRKGFQATGIPRGAAKIIGDSETMAVCLCTCLRAMRAMEARLNIDFSCAVGETKRKKMTGARNHPRAPVNFASLLSPTVAFIRKPIKFRPNY